MHTATAFQAANRAPRHTQPAHTQTHIYRVPFHAGDIPSSHESRCVIPPVTSLRCVVLSAALMPSPCTSHALGALCHATTQSMTLLEYSCLQKQPGQPVGTALHSLAAASGNRPATTTSSHDSTQGTRPLSFTNKHPTKQHLHS